MLSVPCQLMNYTSKRRRLVERPEQRWRDKRPIRRMTFYILQIFFCAAILPDDEPVWPETWRKFEYIKILFLCILLDYFVTMVWQCTECRVWKRRTSTLTRRMCDYCEHYIGAGGVVANVLWITLVHKNKY